MVIITKTTTTTTATTTTTTLIISQQRNMPRLTKHLQPSSPTFQVWKSTRANRAPSTPTRAHLICMANQPNLSGYKKTLGRLTKADANPPTSSTSQEPIFLRGADAFPSLGTKSYRSRIDFVAGLCDWSNCPGIKSSLIHHRHHHSTTIIFSTTDNIITNIIIIFIMVFYLFHDEFISWVKFKHDHHEYPKNISTIIIIIIISTITTTIIICTSTTSSIETSHSWAFDSFPRPPCRQLPVRTTSTSARDPCGSTPASTARPPSSGVRTPRKERQKRALATDSFPRRRSGRKPPCSRCVPLGCRRSASCPSEVIIRPSHSMFLIDQLCFNDNNNNNDSSDDNNSNNNNDKFQGQPTLTVSRLLTRDFTSDE